jgi:transcriptional regulator with XRE-family HTH domain
MDPILNSLGKRIRELRLIRHLSVEHIAVSRGHLCRVELGQRVPSLEMVERLSECFGTGVEVLLGTDERFYATLLLGDSFVMAVRSFLKLLNDEQKQLILRTLEAAPKLSIRQMGRPSVHTESLILEEYRRFTAHKALTSTFPISPTPSLRYPLSRKAKMESHRLQAF